MSAMLLESEPQVEGTYEDTYPVNSSVITDPIPETDVQPEGGHAMDQFHSPTLMEEVIDFLERYDRHSVERR